MNREEDKVSVPKNVHFERHASGLTFTYRWQSWGHMLIAALIFFVLVLPMAHASITAVLNDKSWDEIVIPLIIIVPLLYYCAGLLLNRTILTVTSGQISVRHIPLPWLGNRLIAAVNLKQLRTVEVRHRSTSSSGQSTGPTRYSYDLTAILKNDKEIVLLEGFGSREDVQFFEREIESWLGIKDANHQDQDLRKALLFLRVFKWGGIAFLLIGIGLLITAVNFTFNTVIFLSNAEKAPGIVAELIRRERRDSDGRTSYSYAPKVRFRLPSDNRDREFVSPFGSSPALYRRGEQVTVLYDPKNPNNARIKGLATWSGPIFFSIVGVGFAALGNFFYRRAKSWISMAIEKHRKIMETQAASTRVVDLNQGDH